MSKFWGLGDDRPRGSMAAWRVSFVACLGNGPSPPSCHDLIADSPATHPLHKLPQILEIILISEMPTNQLLRVVEGCGGVVEFTGGAWGWLRRTHSPPQCVCLSYQAAGMVCGSQGFLFQDE